MNTSKDALERAQHLKKRRLLQYALKAVTAGVVAGATLIYAADHAEAPGTQDDAAADITDIYAWHDGDKLVAMLLYDGLKVPVADQAATYDKDVLYTFKIDNTGDNIADINVYVRFGQNADGDWGVQFQGIPGSDDVVEGPVEEIIYVDGGRYAFAGLREDPFFFDLEGFEETIETGTLSFDNTRDSFAGLNVSAIVVEMDLNEALNGAETLQIWATTGRR